MCCNTELKTLNTVSFGPNLLKKGSAWVTLKTKNKFFWRNNKSRLYAFKIFLFYQNIKHVAWIKKFFLFSVMFLLSKKDHFQLKHLWSRCGWSYYSYSYIYAFYLISSTFCPLHDKHFETDEKISCRVDESITILDNAIHRLIPWIDKIDESIFLYLATFFWRKLNLI